MYASVPGLALAALCLWGAVPALRAQAPPAEAPKPPEATISFEEYEPRSTLVVPEHPVTRARFPFIDVHNHQDADEMTPEQVDRLVREMDALNMAVMVNLSGGSGDVFQKSLANLAGRHPKCFRPGRQRRLSQDLGARFRRVSTKFKG